MSMKGAAAFRDALLGVKFLHDHRWVHGDLKPANIGLPRSVLLDTDTSMYLESGDMASPTPGSGGTVDYLAPERELEKYDFAVDIWSMGVIGYELTYGRHPWRLSLNPWRDGEEHESLRPRFRDAYKEAIERLGRHHQRARQSPARGYIHRMYMLLVHYLEDFPKTKWDILPLSASVWRQAIGVYTNYHCFVVGELLIQMLRYPWAPNTPKPRIGIDEVLQHPDWGSDFLPEKLSTKRGRFDDTLEERII